MVLLEVNRPIEKETTNVIAIKNSNTLMSQDLAWLRKAVIIVGWVSFQTAYVSPGLGRGLYGWAGRNTWHIPELVKNL